MEKIWTLLKETFSEWREDNAPRLAAALSYYTAFSIAPILVIAIAVVGIFYQRQAAQDYLLNQVQGLAGAQASDLVNSMLQASQDLGSSIWAVVLGLAALIFGATGVFGQLQEALNTMWDVEAKPSSSLMGFVRTRLISFAMVVSVGFLLLVSLVVSTLLTALNQWSTGLVPGWEIAMQIINLVVSLGVITVLFALVFKYVPDAIVAWKDVWLGAFFTAVLFSIGKYAIGLYLGNAGAVDRFGAAGSLAVLLLWVYYSAQITFFGAEFTQTYANLYGSRIVPDENAVSLEAKRAGSPTSEPVVGGVPVGAPAGPALNRAPAAVAPAVVVKAPPSRRLPAPPPAQREVALGSSRSQAENSVVAFSTMVMLAVGLLTGWIFGKIDN